MRIDTRRVHDGAAESDGCRVLIDRLWPRGISKEAARLDYWAKDIAPSHELRKWYRHEHEKWPEFRERYFAELDANPKGLADLSSAIGPGPLTIVYASKEEAFNNATALREYLLRDTHAAK